MTPGTQADRLLRWLRANPGASSIEITFALRIVNVTGRISDLRQEGFVIECVRGKDHVDRYHVVEPEPVQVALFFGEKAS